MIGLFRNLISRVRALSRTKLIGPDANLIIDSSVNFKIAPGAEIVVNGSVVKIGFAPDKLSETNPKWPSSISIGANAKVIFDGPVVIGPGAIISVAPGATLRFGGHNYINRSVTVLCAREIEIGKGTCTSWGVSLIDDDGHEFTHSSGKTFRLPYRPLKIGQWVGLQMDVKIPRGVTIGDFAVVAAGVILRKDVPSASLVYSEQTLVVHESIRSISEGDVRGL